jgi:hypothetical protein
MLVRQQRPHSSLEGADVLDSDDAEVRSFGCGGDTRGESWPSEKQTSSATRRDCRSSGN